MEERRPTLENTTVVEEADRKTVHSVARVCLAIMQKYKGIPGHDIVLNQIPEGMEEHLTKMLWRKGYLTGMTTRNLRLSSLGEDALKLAIEGGYVNA